MIRMPTEPSQESQSRVEPVAPTATAPYKALTAKKKPSKAIANKKSQSRGAKPAKKAPKVSREELGKQTASEILKLRALLKEVGSAVMDRLDGEAAALGLFLRGDVLPGEKPVLPSARAMKAMLTCFTTLKVKPKKGRVKDLDRIETLMKQLAGKMPPGA